MEISVRRFKGVDGERFTVLVDDAGMPLYYPTLFSTWVLRAESLAANTITNELNALKALCAWESYANIELEMTFLKGRLLDDNQIKDLCDFLQRPLISRSTKKVISINRKRAAVSPSVHYFRLSVAASYVEFLANRLIPAREEASRIARMVTAIKANRPIKSSRSNSDLDEIFLSEDVIQALEDALKPGAFNNPAKDYSVQLRNALMFAILRFTGVRRGELLNLKVEDINFGANTLQVLRRPDSKGDTRKHQPTAKTLPRRMRIAPELINKISEYVIKHRSKVPGAKAHGYLFVTHKSGPSQGSPLSLSSFQKLMSSLADIVEGENFHAHALRHNWNYVFSQLADETGMTPEAEEKARSYIMGWSETSGTARIYNRRHIKEKAQIAALELQGRYLKKSKGVKND